MAVEEKIGWTEYELVPVGLYKAEITDVQEEESQFGRQLQVHFDLNHKGSQGQDVLLSKWISKKLSPRSNLFQLLAAIDGEKPSKEKYPEGVTGSELIGKKCRVMVRHKDSQDGNTYSRIEMFLPFEESSAKMKEKGPS